MKKNIVIVLLILLHFTFANGQVVESSCEAPDSIVQKYQDDAGVLTLRKFYENELPWADSIEIPEVHSDTVLNALLAVWNAEGLAARDTVVGMLEIDAAMDYAVKLFRIKCDTSVNWMNQIVEGNAVSGNDTVDSLLNLYNLYYSFHSIIDSNNYVYFISEICYNMPQLSKLFEDISGVISVFATSGYIANVYENIEIDIYSDNVVLHYSFGWGDCPSGCLNWRHWDFKVYYDCSVEFIESYGDILPGTGINNPNGKYNISVFPNPCNNFIILEGTKINDFPLTYAIYNSNGIKVLTGKTTNNRIEFNGKLNNGLYILELYTDTETIRKKIQIVKTD
jgi:hypothetical protein